ncbi:MAG: hypothetical protein EAZ20_11420 [Bacteroidetes bacterium]|nr:MAG: hypothetical protein EAZ20_11420 [Bacteroidota bacterium]
MKKYFFLIILYLFFFTDIFAQTEYRGITPKFNVGVNRSGFYSDVNISLCYRNASKKGGDFINIDLPERGMVYNLGVETNYFFKTDFRITPKITLEYHFYRDLFTFRWQNRFYPAQNNDFSKTSFQTCPEAGINILGLVFLTYGYSFGLTNRDVTKDLGHQVNIGFSVPIQD